MQEIITEILEKLGFPTKNVEKLVKELQNINDYFNNKEKKGKE